MVAGPNGSGKSTLFDYLEKRGDLPLGYCFNPDHLERQVRETGELDFVAWGIAPNEAELLTFLQKHPLASRATQPVEVKVNGDKLLVEAASSGGYLIAMLGDYMRRQWIATRQTFTFETVMSHPDKVELLRTARAAGYRTYLYFVCTDRPRINAQRVAQRAALGGHDVPADKIASRYDATLRLLPDAIRQSDRAYLFDNSGAEHQMIAEFERAKVKSIEADLPGWFVRTVLAQSDLMIGA